MANLRIYSVFKSIQGEVNAWGQGRLAVFIRLVGCNLRCSYCDTMYAVLPNGKFKPYSVDELLNKLWDYEPYKYVTITGGEPLLQAEGVVELTSKLISFGKKVVIETNGSFDIIDSIHNENTSWVMDYKLPSSGEVDAMMSDWFHKLTNNDYVKFVVAGEDDFEYAKQVVSQIQDVNADFENFAFSPVFNGKNSIVIKDLADNIISMGLPGVIFNLQLHKLIWEEDGNEH